MARDGSAPTSRSLGLIAGQSEAVDLLLVAPASISGRVVTDAGTAVGGASVRVYTATADGYPGTAYRTVTADSGGRWTVDAVDAPASYVLEVAVSAGADPLVSRLVTVGPSATLTDQDFVLAAGS